MRTYTQRKAALPGRAGGDRAAGESGHTAARRDGGTQASASPQRELQEALSQSPRVQTQLKLGRALNEGPRAVAQARLTSTLAERPTTLAAEVVAQRQTAEEEETLTTQARLSSVAAPVQAQSGDDAATAGAGGGTKGGLPAGLRAGVEALSGVSLADVRVEYNSAEPARLGALATTQGRDIKLGRGQERHLPHEAWHAAQQKQGRVRATTQLRRTPVNDDRSLEREADVMGARAASLRAPVQLRGDAGYAPHAGRVPRRETTDEGALQGKFVYKDYDLGDYADDIAEYIETNNGKKAADSFRRMAANKRNNDFEKWANARGRNVDWEQILMDIVGFDPDWEAELFGQRMEGMPLSGYIPVVEEGGKKKKMLEQVPRSGPGSFDYTSDEDKRILQTLRQISSQFYVYLEAADKLAQGEQEIQTMWAYGNLILASNVPGTLDALYTELKTLSVGVNASQKLFDVLTGTYAPKKFLGVISERHGAKLSNLYQSMRQPGSGHLKKIVEALAGASVSKITDVTDEDQVKQVADGSGNVYLLTSASPGGVAHAEQRLVEFRNFLEVYKQDPKAWVAGKKRPCFGCWIKLMRTNTEQAYELVYMDQPGKAFMGTYRVAEPPEKEEWYATLQDETTTFYETQGARGEVGPESESESEDEISFDDPEKLMTALASDKLTKSQREAINFFSREAGVDTRRVAEYVGRKRKKGDDAVDTDEEDNLEQSARKWANLSQSSANPGIRKAFGFKTGYKKKTPAKKRKIQPNTT